MSELTVVLDDGIASALEQMAREKSVPLGTLVAESLAELAKTHKARARLRELIATTTMPLDADWTWNREDLYDRDVFRRHERGPVRDDGTEE